MVVKFFVERMVKGEAVVDVRDECFDDPEPSRRQKWGSDE